MYKQNFFEIAVEGRIEKNLYWLYDAIITFYY